MLHPSEAELIAFADGELDRDRRRTVDVHLRECGICRHALRDLEGAMAGLTVELALVDAAEPSAWRTAVGVPSSRPVSQRSRGEGTQSGHPARGRLLSLHSAGTRTPLGARHFPSGSRHNRAVAMRWAAAMLMLAAGGAAAMVAPRWRSMLASSSAVVPAHEAPSGTARVVAAAAPATASAAVSILPERGEATIALTSRPGGGDGRVMVRVSDRRDVQVTVTAALDSGTLPRFTSADGRLEVQLAGHGSVVQVELPSSLRSARITHEGRTIVTVRGTEILPADARMTGVVIHAAPKP